MLNRTQRGAEPGRTPETKHNIDSGPRILGRVWHKYLGLWTTGHEVHPSAWMLLMLSLMAIWEHSAPSVKRKTTAMAIELFPAELLLKLPHLCTAACMAGTGWRRIFTVVIMHAGAIFDDAPWLKHQLQSSHLV